MMKNVFLFLGILFSFAAKAQPASTQTLVNVNGWNAYVYLPSDYYSNSNNYKTILFSPGLGEVGSTASAVIANGPGAYITQGWKGQVGSTKFIVISLQPPGQWPSVGEVKKRIDTLKNRYRIGDIYLTGLSMGGWVSLYQSYTYPTAYKKIVGVESVVPVEYSTPGDYDNRHDYVTTYGPFAKAGGTALLFEQVHDIRKNSWVVDGMNDTVPGSAIYVSTNFGGGGHCCWNEFYGGQGKAPGVFTIDGASQTLYGWLASDSSTSPVIAAPIVNSGGNRSVTSPATSISITGVVTWASGHSGTTLWSKVSGSGGSISSPNSLTTNITGLSVGSYVYKLTATQDDAQVVSSNMTITVSASIAPPTVTTSSNQTITLPTNSVNLTAVATPGSGAIIISYGWSKVSGGAATIATPSSNTTDITGLVVGVYVFRVLVTQSDAQTVTKDVTVTVNPAQTGGLVGAPILVYGTGWSAYNPASAWVQLPDDYSPSKKYPVLVYIHSLAEGPTTPFDKTTYEGGGYLGNIYNSVNNPAYKRENGWDGSAVNPKTGLTEKFIIVSPQTRSEYGGYDENYLGFTLGYLNSNYSIDTNRIYLTGNTYGAFALTAYASNLEVTDGSAVNNRRFPVAAIVPMSATANAPTIQQAQNLVTDSVHAWGFVSSGGNQNSKDLITKINAIKPSWGRSTTFSGAECCWGTYYDPSYTESIGGNNMNIYSWMLQYTHGTSTPLPGGKPIVTIASPKAVSASTTTLSPSVTFASGHTGTYLWKQVAGGSAVISSPTSLSTGITGLADGSYTFRIVATQDDSQKDSAQVVVNVTIGSIIVTAGTNHTVTMPVSQIVLSGSASGGGSKTYTWTEQTSNYSTINTPTSASTTVKDLAAGTYTFRLTATDGSNSGFGEVTVTVLSQNVGSVLPKTVVILGSSTSFGTGITPSSDAYVNRFATYLQSIIPGSNVVNLAMTTYTTYQIQATGTTPPAGRPAPDVSRNITKALTYNPDAVIINLPTNDANNDYTLAEQKANYQAVVTLANAQGIPVWVTTTQPRNYMTVPEMTLLTEMRDWITSTYGTNSVDFWSTFANPDGTIVTALGQGDGIHLNNMAHKKLFARVANSSLITSIVAGGGVEKPSYKIPITPSAIFWKGDTSFFQVINTMETGYADRLFDEQAGNDPKAGVTNITQPSTRFFPNWAAQTNYPEMGILDLGGTYKITDMWINTYYTSDTLVLKRGQPYGWIDSIKIRIEGTGWKQVPMTPFTTRFMKYSYMEKGSQAINEMVLYGYSIGDTLSRTAPIDYTTLRAKPKMNKFIGSNVFGDPFDVREIGGNLRRYVNTEWFDTAVVTHNVDDIKYAWINYGDTTKNASVLKYTFPGKYAEEAYKTVTYTGNMQYDFKYFKDRGIDEFLSMQTTPQFALSNGLYKPIDPVVFPDRDSTSPMEYTRTGRMFWQIAAAYGSVKHSRDSMQISTLAKDSSGLGVMKYIELGNEMDRGWNGKQEFYSTAAITAFMSAGYDGNNGRMGNRFGVKRADPSIKVLEPGQVRFSFPRYKAMRLYSYYMRTDKKLPFDIISYHQYFWNDDPVDPHSLSPEQYDVRKVISKQVDTAHLVCPSCEVWFTEFGFDRNRGSDISVPPIAGSDSATTQAQWIARTWFMLSFTGLDRADQFMIRNAGTPDYDINNKYRYNTSGLVSGFGYYDAPNYIFNYYAYPSYYYQKTLFERLKDYVPDAIIHENVNGDSIYVYKYRKGTTDSVAYAVWSGTGTNRTLPNYKIKANVNSMTTQVVTLADKYMLGKVSNVTTSGIGYIPVIISETPRLIFAKDVVGGGTITDAGGVLPIIIRRFFIRKGKLIFKEQ